MSTKKNTGKVKKVDGLSSDVRQERIEALRQLAPEVFADGKIDVKKLEKLFGADNMADDERYRLEWAGKSQVFDEIAERSSCTLTLDEKRSSKDWKQSDNVFIEGENLEVLRTLQKAYHGKVKMIYIDPPYNTGEDFVYNDNFRETEEEYCDDGCNVDENGLLKKAYKLNSRDSGRFHSNWLSMMYPRLYLARNLLRDDGVIFVSIDDNEYHNLRSILDEIYGEENFVANFIWEKRTNRENRKIVSSRHDYVLCYTKNSSLKEKVIRQLPMSDKALASYKNPDKDPRGLWKSDPATAQAGHGTQSQFYDFTAPNGKTHKLQSGRCWLYTKNEFQKKVSEGRIWFGKDGNGVPRVKTYLNEKERGLTPESILFAEEAATNEIAKVQLKELFDGHAAFDTPKPVSLIQLFLQMCIGRDDIVLDFFSGSAPTAHAVMLYNAIAKSNVQYISVQVPEETSEGSEARRMGYQIISNVAIDRIKKAAKKIKKEYPDYKGDLDVRVYKETESHFPKWHAKAFESDESLEQAMIDYSKSDVAGSPLDRATEVLLKLGYPLTTPLEEKKGYLTTSDGVMLVLDQKTAPKDMLKVLEDEPKTIIVLEKLFKKDEEKINFSLRCKEAGVIFQTV